VFDNSAASPPVIGRKAHQAKHSGADDPAWAGDRLRLHRRRD
jgi:hypothetical protein